MRGQVRGCNSYRRRVPGILVLVHPALERMDHWFGVLFAALQAATGALIALAVAAARSADGAESSSYADTALWVAEGASHFALVMVAVQAIIGLVAATTPGCAIKSHSSRSIRLRLKDDRFL
jgi:hypothetical protein